MFLGSGGRDALTAIHDWIAARAPND